MVPIGYKGARKKLIREKSLKLKILCQPSFKNSLGSWIYILMGNNNRPVWCMGEEACFALGGRYIRT
jgi:hypothetical protein